MVACHKMIRLVSALCCAIRYRDTNYDRALVGHCPSYCAEKPRYCIEPHLRLLRRSGTKRCNGARLACWARRALPKPGPRR